MGILTNEEIGARLREFRKNRGMTQEQLAEAIDVTFQQIQKYENGTTRLNADKLQTIAQKLSIPVSAFFDYDSRYEYLLSEQEMKLIEGFRLISDDAVRSFVVSCLSK